MSTSARRDRALRRLLHDLRSGILGVGAVGAGLRARLDAGADERTLRELALILRAADGLDRTLAHARALVAPPRASQVALDGALAAALARAAAALAARRLTAPALPPLPSVRADALLLDALLDHLVTAVTLAAGAGARLRVECAARRGAIRLALVAEVAAPAEPTAAVELLRATAARMNVKVGLRRSTKNGTIGQVILRRGS